MDLNFIYLATLATIQPARIQDIEKYAVELFSSVFSEKNKQSLRDIHHTCIETGLVISVRKGVYIVSKEANEILRTGNFGRGIDNRRLFLLKQVRKGIK